MNLYNRKIYFKDKIAIGTFDSQPYDYMEIIQLPSNHYDFIGPIKVFGKTKEEIEEECRVYLNE